jgi:thioredoxin-like negative regulator of GroEL
VQTTINDFHEFDSFVKENAGAVAYFSTPECNVCKVLKPKLIDFLKEEFPEMKFAYVDVSKARELAGQNAIFAVPTILFFLEGREFIRKSRNVNFTDLRNQLERVYSLVFEN